MLLLLFRSTIPATSFSKRDPKLAARSVRPRLTLSFAVLVYQRKFLRGSLEYAGPYHVAIQLVPTSALKGLPMFCAQFIAGEVLSQEYEKILMLDADTQISGSLDAPVLLPAIPGQNRGRP